APAQAPALAHVLELPGKMRLTRDRYLTVQPIYYPGFTIAGIGEAAGLILTLILLFITPEGTTLFWLTLVALIGFVGMQVVYWIFTHPVNKYWLEGQQLTNMSSTFFLSDPLGGSHRTLQVPESGWMKLRDRWEYSHAVRAGFALISLLALIIALKSSAP